MQHRNAELEDLARTLEDTGDYKVLRRLIPRQTTPTPVDYSGKLGIVVDFETTGLDATKDEIIEVAMLKYRYSDEGEISGVSDIFQAFNQPSSPIPARIVELTGITDAMVVGQKIDGAALERFVSDASIVIAHNAGFDRRFAEKSWKVFEQKQWGCSAMEVGWRKYGFGGAKLSYLLAGAGFFHDAHRAIDDCHAVIEILARPLPSISTTALAVLLDRAGRNTFCIWAENSPYDLKNVLKARGYRWNDGTDGRPRSWHIDVDEMQRDNELAFLRKEVYQRDVDILCREFSALDRFSNRVR